MTEPGQAEGGQDGGRHRGRWGPSRRGLATARQRLVRTYAVGRPTDLIKAADARHAADSGSVMQALEAPPANLWMTNLPVDSRLRNAIRSATLPTWLRTYVPSGQPATQRGDLGIARYSRRSTTCASHRGGEGDRVLDRRPTWVVVEIDEDVRLVGPTVGHPLRP